MERRRWFAPACVALSLPASAPLPAQTGRAGPAPVPAFAQQLTFTTRLEVHDVPVPQPANRVEAGIIHRGATALGGLVDNPRHRAEIVLGLSPTGHAPAVAAQAADRLCAHGRVRDDRRRTRRASGVRIQDRSLVVPTLISRVNPKYIAAVKQWRFNPARLNGQPVAASVAVVLEFTLH